jgi:hypothetical protein
MDGAYSTHRRGEKWIHNFGWKNPVQSEDLGADESKILQWILWIQSGRLWTGIFWLRMETVGGLLLGI